MGRSLTTQLQDPRFWVASWLGAPLALARPWAGPRDGLVNPGTWGAFWVVDRAHFSNPKFFILWFIWRY